MIFEEEKITVYNINGIRYSKEDAEIALSNSFIKEGGKVFTQKFDDITENHEQWHDNATFIYFPTQYSIEYFFFFAKLKGFDDEFGTPNKMQSNALYAFFDNKYYKMKYSL